jgi:uncharacterized protein
LFFPDLNVWLALTVEGHSHNEQAWNWVNLLSGDGRLLFCRYTQLGMLRLLTNDAVMGEHALALRKAWEIYERWMEDPRVDFYPEPRSLDTDLRKATQPFAARKAPKWVGDCYLLAYAAGCGATLVTFDRALFNLARKHGYAAIMPS